MTSHNSTQTSTLPEDVPPTADLPQVPSAQADSQPGEDSPQVATTVDVGAQPASPVADAEPAAPAPSDAQPTLASLLAEATADQPFRDPDAGPAATQAAPQGSASAPSISPAAAPGVVNGASTAAPFDPSKRPEAEAKGVRIGQLLWAAIVILTGLGLIALAFVHLIDVPLALISLVAVLGVALIVAAIAVGRRG